MLCTLLGNRSTMVLLLLMMSVMQCAAHDLFGTLLALKQNCLCMLNSFKRGKYYILTQVLGDRACEEAV